MRWKIFMFKTLQKRKLINISTKRWYILSHFTDEAWPKLLRQPGGYWDWILTRLILTRLGKLGPLGLRILAEGWAIVSSLQEVAGRYSAPWHGGRSFSSQVLKSSHRLVNCLIPSITSADLMYMKSHLSLTNFGELGTDSTNFPSKKKKVRSKMQLSVFSPQNYYNENSSQWPMLILVCIRPHIYIDVYNVKP